ncbi:beta-lactamase family protein [Dactylosporangium sp. NBC_01737]|uniref:serine hydrolase domain-containing protein n=1 Tax=Dactylosporangium sp. NBC_01737 TaxID=2975959 RepID=UPI002E15508E|nr:beta-lactamase family protein [Dactylosporangium sp. NBC_01737]
MTTTYTSSRRRRIGMSVAVGLATLAVVGGAVRPAWAGGSISDRLQRDTDAIHALGVTGVQARVTTVDGRRIVTTSGVADVGTGRPVPSDGRFRIASTRKAFTATVALQLVGEHRLSLDDTVERWLPGVVQGVELDGRLITVRHLLQNTSGLHDDLPGYTSPAEYLEQRYDVHTREELVARAMRHRPDFAPGTAWAYSNTGFILAGMLVERVTGRSLQQEITDRIVRPLGLRDTTWPGTAPSLPRPHANAYELFPTGELVDVTSQVPGDPDSIVSTTADLDRFFRALLGGRLLRPAQLAEMRRTVPVSADVEPIWPGGRYGLGLARRPLPCGGFYWGHDGGDAGYITVTGVTADGRRSAVVSMSSARGDSFDHLLQQQRAADTLVVDALCARPRSA